MRKSLLLGSVCLNLVIIAAYLVLRQTESVVAEKEGLARPDGDVNGDGSTDVTDAIHLLSFLFQSGPPPAPVAESRAVLPVTGQMKCYDGLRGDEIPCPAPGMPFFGQDASYLKGIPHDFELVKPDESAPSTWYTVDHSTGLAWQYQDDGVKRYWRDALDYCEGLELGGFTDWRLPNMVELHSIVDIAVFNPSVDARYFKAEARNYWSSSSCVYDSSRAWIVRFTNGETACLDKGSQDSFLFFTRAVRSLEE